MLATGKHPTCRSVRLVDVQARTKLVQQVRRLSQALKAADKGTPVRSGRVSRKTFAKALAKEGGLGRVGEAELTR